MSFNRDHPMKKSIVVLLFIAVTLSCVAQSSMEYYRSAKLYLNNSKIMTVEKLKISAMKATFYNTTTQKSETMALENVNLITIKKGNHIWEGAIYGAVTGALTGLLVDIDEDPFGRPNKVSVGEYMGIAAGGAALGAIIGSFFPKWKQIYSKMEFLGLNIPMHFDFDTQQDKVYIKLTIPL